MKKFGDGTIRLASKGREVEIADHLFPAAPVTNWDRMPSPETRNIFENVNPEADEPGLVRTTLEFTAEELLKATKKMSSGKGGGPSGIPNEILKRIVLARPRATLKVYNVERLLFQRLDSHLAAYRTEQAPNQFGFRKGISTETAVEVVTKLAAHAGAGNWRQKEL